MNRQSIRRSNEVCERNLFLQTTRDTHRWKYLRDEWARLPTHRPGGPRSPPRSDRNAGRQSGDTGPTTPTICRLMKVRIRTARVYSMVRPNDSITSTGLYSSNRAALQVMREHNISCFNFIRVGVGSDILLASLPFVFAPLVGMLMAPLTLPTQMAAASLLAARGEITSIYFRYPMKNTLGRLLADNSAAKSFLLETLFVPHLRFICEIPPQTSRFS